MSTEEAKTSHIIESEWADMKLKKSRYKAVYTRYINRILELCGDEDTTKDEYKESIHKVETAMDNLLSYIEQMINFCKTEGKTDELKSLTEEMEAIEKKYEKMLELYQCNLCDTKSNISYEATSSKEINPGKDMYKQLAKVSIPTFFGNKEKYESWKAAFMACVDIAPATPEYKLLQLRQCLSGDALKAIEDLGHSKSAYEAAKRRLERKFGGERRKANLFIDRIDNFPVIRYENAKIIEDFADLIDIAVINLKEKSMGDLESNYLYQQLLRKLPESMIARYERWVYEHHATECVEMLNNWISKESEFKTAAQETRSGISKPKEKSFFVNNSGVKKRSCKICNNEHPVWKCQTFKLLPVNERWQKAKEHRLCFRCLEGNHRGSECKWDKKCNIEGCEKTHNRLLHGKALNVDADEFQPNSSITPENKTYTSNDNSYIALRTVPVIVRANGRELKINALLDDGSTKTYLNDSVAAELGIVGMRKMVDVNVLNGKVDRIATMNVSFDIKSVKTNFIQNIEASTVKEVTGRLKPVDWNVIAHKWPHLTNIRFPVIHKKDKIDLLIGSDNSFLHKSLAEVSGKLDEPVARLTPLGWTCIGDTGQYQEDTTLFTFHTAENELDIDLKKFWELESVPCEVETLSQQDRLIESRVKNSIDYKNGRYIVPIPWKDEKVKLQSNYSTAVKRFDNTENRLQKNEALKQEYGSTILKYVEKGYVKRLEYPDLEVGWYLPHFPVIKPDRQTTKIRIVFDASAKHEQTSLNENIYPGPKLQTELFDVLLRFRKKPIALVCDIAEMYLQIELREEDQQYHRFLWRESPEKPIDVYQFSRLVFGVNASPFLPQLIFRHNATLHAEQFPLANETVLNSTYMDDSMDSVDTEEEAIELYQQLSQIWGKANMKARKWMSNSLNVLKLIPEDDRVAEMDIESKQLPTMKALGMTWKAESDTFAYKIGEELKLPKVLTKRSILRIVAKIFDPLGFLSPFTIRGKVLMQETWLSGIDWDETVGEDLSYKFDQWFSELSEMKNVEIPRCIREENVKFKVKQLSLHAFVDASSIAYGTVVYIRYDYENGPSSVRIIASKSKVAPLESTSIPRLELLAAVLGLRLTSAICKVLGFDLENATFWSDSMNVLHWIRNQSRGFKTFVANRIGEIHRSTKPHQWRFVPTTENAADAVSRGTNLCELIKSQNWWQGPEFLKKEKCEWPKNKVDCTEYSTEEMKIGRVMNYSVLFSYQCEDDEWLLKPERYSNWRKFVRVFAWVVRFIENCRVNRDCRSYDPLKVQELEDRTREIIRDTQRYHFKEECDLLIKERSIHNSSKLIKYNPIIDSEGILRCDGRLKYAEYLPYDTRYPIILPRKSEVTRLIVKDAHEQNKHSGTNQTLADLSVHYCIIAAREEIRQCENNCLLCKRMKVKPGTQIMAPLPDIRVNMPLRAFAHTAVDYGGPYITIQGRGKRRQKRYLCLFTCLSTRAVHLEMAFGLDTDSFLNAFNRMINRRGIPVKMLSDNGSNFIGAEREIRDLVVQLDKDKILDKTSSRSIVWQFNPPLAPHWGGIHESMIKSAKRAIMKILGNADITDEELMTAFTGAESLLNSRPLTYQSANPADCTALTPNHFLFGQAGGQFAPQSVDETNYNPVKRWRRVQELVAHFWKRWLHEWLPSLNTRSKWNKETKNLRVGDIVLVILPDTPRGCWPLGRITKIHLSKDGHVRAATVLVGNKEILRPIVKLCSLELDI